MLCVIIGFFTRGASFANAQCANLAGTWSYAETGSVTLSLVASDGETANETDPVQGYGNVTITQTGPCTFQYEPIPLSGSSWLDQNLTQSQLAALVRTVTVSGNSAQASGVFVVINTAFAQQNGITVTSVNPNSVAASGQITTNIIDIETLLLATAGNATVTGTAVNNGQTITFTITISASTTATLTTSGSLPSATLSVNNGGGQVTSSDGYINCGFECSANYVLGTTVNLTAYPVSGMEFLQWSGCDQSSGSLCTITVEGARGVIAYYAPVWGLFLFTSGLGTITSNDGTINCGAQCFGSYLDGTTVVLTATPATGWAFSGWSGCSAPSGNTCTLTMNASQVVTANFVVADTLTVSDAGSGVVTSSDEYINCGSVCSHAYLSGTSVLLTATPAANYILNAWSGCDSQVGNTCTVAMNRNRSVIAYFQNVWTLSVTTSGSGTITSTDGYINCGPTCSHIYPVGSTVVMNATPAQGWAFTGWSGACTGTGSCTVAMTQAQAVGATFQQVYPLSVAVTGSGTVTSSDGLINCGTSCSHLYLSGTSVTLTATPSAQNVVLTQWLGCDRVTGNVCTVSMYAARSVSATFKVTYSLTVSTSGSGTVFSGDSHINCGSACSYSYPAGTVLALTAMPANGWTVGNWTGCQNIQRNVCTVTISAATSVSAAFSPAPIAFASLTFAPPVARPGTSSIGTLVLAAPAPSGGVVVNFASTEPDIVEVPSVIFISGGATSIQFPARIIGVRPVTATITATSGNASISADIVVTWGSGKPVIYLNTPAPNASQLSGRAYNVDTNRLKVVIYVLTNQWYVQPFANAPFTDISPTGSWSSYTNPWQSIVAILVDPNTYTPAPTKITNPALDPGVLAYAVYPPGPVSIHFSGYTWGIKTTGQLPGDQFDPGPNYWSNDPSVVHLASDGLHLNNLQLNGNWESGEVYLTQSLGYGTYTVQIDSHLDQLDQNTVAAPLFIYASPTQELDNEYSGPGGLVPSPYNSQFVVQPYTVAGNIVYYVTPSTGQFTTQIDWRSDHVTFTAWNGWASTPDQTTLIYQWTYTGADIPVPGQERVHINLWLLNGSPPVSGIGDGMVINSFTFQP